MRTVSPLQTDNTITLFAPALQNVPAALVRADAVPAGEGGVLRRHLDLFGINHATNRDLPIAAITSLADMGAADTAWVIRADPVYLEARRDGLVLRHPVELTMEESAQLVAELNASLLSEGWQLQAPHPQRWYLKLATGPGITTTPLAEVTGQDVNGFLPQGPDRRLWHTRLNEIQILLHSSAVNAKREARGLPPINSVWFWGGGRLPSIPPTSWSAVWASDPLTVGLARLAGLMAQPLAARYAGGRELVVLDETLGEGAVALLLEAMVTAVHKGESSTLTVITASGPAWRYCRRHRWRFWRRARTASS